MTVTREHIGKQVTDGKRTGILSDILKDWVDGSRPKHQRQKVTTAFVRPVGGGREWTARPGRLRPL